MENSILDSSATDRNCCGGGCEHVSMVSAVSYAECWATDSSAAKQTSWRQRLGTWQRAFAAASLLSPRRQPSRRMNQTFSRRYCQGRSCLGQKLSPHAWEHGYLNRTFSIGLLCTALQPSAMLTARTRGPGELASVCSLQRATIARWTRLRIPPRSWSLCYPFQAANPAGAGCCAAQGHWHHRRNAVEIRCARLNYALRPKTNFPYRILRLARAMYSRCTCFKPPFNRLQLHMLFTRWLALKAARH
jgi:hypothetical protein